MPKSNDPEITALTEQLRDLEAQREAIEARLATLLQVSPSEPHSVPPRAAKDRSPQEKVDLFRKLFAGRPDVFALRWDNTKDGRSGYAPACSNEWAPGICGKPKIKCGACPNQAFIPVSDEVIKRHLRGYIASSNRRDFVMGAYPLLQDDTCWFLAADFDGEQWATDALAYVQTCNSRNVPAALERSRSGQGGHVWIFFSAPIAAREARQLGAALMTETMERRPEIGFASYDRFFPNQDFMPAGGGGGSVTSSLFP
jgi:hypothetical protein